LQMGGPPHVSSRYRTPRSVTYTPQEEDDVHR
jgi:hypothetical protein